MLNEFLLFSYTLRNFEALKIKFKGVHVNMVKALVWPHIYKVFTLHLLSYIYEWYGISWRITYHDLVYHMQVTYSAGVHDNHKLIGSTNEFGD